jgi:DNA-binding HxlR family transcriptional regulator
VGSITDALAIVGDRYALLVARELRYGQTRFQDIAAGTRAPATSSPPGCASSSDQ